MSGITYRRDIDGLRAVAVMLVILTHSALFECLGGGFIGVDVFFVISGYLIGAILMKEIDRKHFSIAEFYRRRILRILPGLFLVLAVSMAAACLFLFPVELIDYANSAIAAIVFGSNILFWSQTGYFDAPALSKPLLHTWSLGVEEQYYLLFPLLLIFLWRHARRRIGFWLSVIGLLSFLGSAIAAFVVPDAAFYLLPTRIWELLLGAILAGRSANWSGPVRNLAACGGLMAIVAPAFLYSGATVFPGLAALPPCAGTAAIILSGPNTFTSRLLSLKPIVFIGLISYSLYLWHWPILVFQQAAMLLPANAHMKIVTVELLGIIFVLSVATWRFVELPFRGKAIRVFSNQAIFAMALTMSALFIGANALITASHGLPERFAPNAIKIASFLNYDPAASLRTGDCFVDQRIAGSKLPKHCIIKTVDKTNFMLVGNSHAAHLYSGLAHIFPQASISQVTLSGCHPFLNPDPADGAYCIAVMHELFTKLLVGRYNGTVLLARDWRDSDIAGLAETLRWTKARRIRVIVIGPMPRYAIALPRLMALSIRNNDMGIVQRSLIPDLSALDVRMKQMTEKLGAPYISLMDIICPDGACRTYAKTGVPMQFDTSHLTQEGSIYVAEQIHRRGYLTAP